MSTKSIPREILRAEAERLVRRFRGLFPNMDRAVGWRFTPPTDWAINQTVEEEVPSYVAVTLDGEPADKPLFSRHIRYHGHEVPRGDRTWAFFGRPETPTMTALLGEVPGLRSMSRSWRGCRRMARAIRQRLDVASPDEVRFEHAVYRLSRSPWVTNPSLRGLPVEYGSAGTWETLFTAITPTHEVDVSPPPLDGLEEAIRQLAAPSPCRSGRPRKQNLTSDWEEAHRLYSELGNWVRATAAFNARHQTSYTCSTISGWGRYLRRQGEREAA